MERGEAGSHSININILRRTKVCLKQKKGIIDPNYNLSCVTSVISFARVAKWTGVQSGGMFPIIHSRLIVLVRKGGKNYEKDK